MKILLLDTGRGAGPETIATWRSRLELAPGDELSLLGWNPPREPLPVTTHLVFGPDLRPGIAVPKRAETAPVTSVPAPPAESGSTGSDAQATPGPAASAGGAAELTEQTPLPPEPQADAADATAETPADPTPVAPVAPTGPAAPSPRELARQAAQERRERIAALPAYHPTRLKQAATWRATKATRFGRRAIGRAQREVVTRSGMSPERRRVIANNAISAQFGLSALASAPTRRLFAEADLVVPMDTRSQPAAWLLAQRIPGPDVVVGIPAAVRIVAEHRG